MPDKSYVQYATPIFVVLRDVFRALINSPECGFRTSALSLVLFQIVFLSALYGVMDST